MEEQQLTALNLTLDPMTLLDDLEKIYPNQYQRFKDIQEVRKYLIDEEPSPETSRSSKLKTQDRLLKIIKIAIPHLAIYLALTCYLLTAAYIFYKLENDEDKAKQLNKLREIQNVYARIAQEVEVDCGPGKEKQLYASLSR